MESILCLRCYSSIHLIQLSPGSYPVRSFQQFSRSRTVILAAVVWKSKYEYVCSKPRLQRNLVSTERFYRKISLVSGF
jgi:hypothetical protein